MKPFYLCLSVLRNLITVFNPQLLMLIRLLNKNKITIFLLLLWSAVQIFFFKTQGVKLACDSPIYIDYAKDILENGFFIREHDFWYFGYVLFLAFSFLLGLDYTGVVLFQIALSGLSIICLSQIGRKLTGQYLTGVILAFLYIIWMKIHQWNFFLMTESFFTSCQIFTFFLLLKTRENIRYYILFIPVLFLTVLGRPVGIATLVCLLVYGMTYLYQRNPRSFKKVAIAIVSLSCVLGVFLLNKMLTSFTLVERFATGEIIYIFKGWVVESSKPVVLPPDDASPLLKLILFFYENTWFTVKLMLCKLLVFFGNVRPYFSWKHNLIVVCFLYPVYMLAFYGVFNKAISMAGRLYALVFIGLQGLIIMLTIVNWDGRFLIPVLPFVFLLASCGFVKLINSKLLFLSSKLSKFKEYR